MSWVPYAVTASAAWAAGWNAWAAYEAPRPFRRIYLATTIHAAFYVGAYLWLILDDGLNQATWSRAVMPFGLSAFLIVWAGPAMISAPARRKERKRDHGQ